MAGDVLETNKRNPRNDPPNIRTHTHWVRGVRNPEACLASVAVAIRVGRSGHLLLEEDMVEGLVLAFVFGALVGMLLTVNAYRRERKR